jgi:hypothetical protein
MNMHDRSAGIRAARESDLEAVFDVWYRTDVLTDNPAAVPARGPIPAYLRHVLETGTLHVAERQGAIVGFAGAVERGGIVFLTDLFVDPLHQSGSLGKTLLRSVLPHGDGSIHCTLSSSDPRAQSLYIRSGMAPLWPYFGLSLDEPSSAWHRSAPEVEVREALAGDLPDLVKIDEAIGGRYRPQEHTFWVEQEQAVPLWFQREGRSIGYGYVRLGAGTVWHPEACAVGPVGAVNAEDASVCALAAARWAAVRAPVIRIGVPGPHGSLRLLLEGGFHISYVDSFMSSAPAPFFDPRCYIPSGGDFL